MISTRCSTVESDAVSGDMIRFADPDPSRRSSRSELSMSTEQLFRFDLRAFITRTKHKQLANKEVIIGYLHSILFAVDQGSSLSWASFPGHRATRGSTFRPDIFLGSCSVPGGSATSDKSFNSGNIRPASYGRCRNPSNLLKIRRPGGKHV